MNLSTRIKEAEERCKSCSKKTKKMFVLNDGIYCENHFQISLINQRAKLELESLKQRLETYLK